MELNLGLKIRELRHRDGRTQDALAETLGVTAQAVSRWESGGSYPDMTLIPAIANYFHISIDALFGYHDEREQKIKSILDNATKILTRHGFILHKDSLSEEVGECVNTLRTAMEEFPNEPKILLKLAQALNMWGWHKYGAQLHHDEILGIMQEDVEYNTQNIYWREALGVYEKLLKSNPSLEDRETAICQLVPLYCRMGEYEKAKALANQQNTISICKEFLLPLATKGKEKAHYMSERIGALISKLRLALSESVALNPKVSGSEDEKLLLLSLIGLYEAVFTDGKFGFWHWDICYSYLNLVRCEIALGGDTKDIIAYFDKAFCHYKEYERIYNEGDYEYSAPLVSNLNSLEKGELQPLGENFWKNEIISLPKNICEEISKNSKYAECFA